VSLQIDEIEHFALPGRQLAKETADVFGDTLTIDSRTGICVIYVVDTGNRRIGEPSSPACCALPLKCHPAADQINPSFYRRFAAILFELSINENERLLRYLVGLIRVVSEGQCPSVHERLECDDYCRECIDVSKPCPLNKRLEARLRAR
jgi:hypothetical protein